MNDNDREKDTKSLLYGDDWLLSDDEAQEAQKTELRAYDVIDNITLIEDGLRHLELELMRDCPVYHRVAKEAYSILYKSMIEALRGSANLEVTGRESKNGLHIYTLGEGPFKEIHKIKIQGCKEAWRYSEPVICSPPKQSDRKSTDRSKRPGANRLIDFYVALARIQTENFMETMTHSKRCTISDYDMHALEILHSAIRNEFEHFIPHARLTSIDDLLYMSKLCLNVAKELLFESGKVFFHNRNEQDVKDRIENNLIKLNQHITKRQRKNTGV